MGGHAGIALVQTMGGGLAGKRLADPQLQGFLLTVVAEQIPQLHPVVTEQTEVQLAHGGDPQPIATGAEVLAVGHDEPHSPL